MTMLEILKSGKTSLGIELGSTRIKSVLVDDGGDVIASGDFQWENQYIDGNWTYSLDAVWEGVQGSYRALKNNVIKNYGYELETVGSIGISAMMHGYLAFDQNDALLVPFRTWRNTATQDSEKMLTEALAYTMPQRWSAVHYFQAMLNRESHVEEVASLNTLAGYVHWQLTGEKILGIGDASGMFPIDSDTLNYDEKRLERFNELAAAHGYRVDLKALLPKAVVAGCGAGSLTHGGAMLLDPAGTLRSGIPLCPPEGDAGTGMVATNSVKVKTGNVSAGTSIFAMVVLDHELANAYPEVDRVTTPSGERVAMVHANNCSTEIDAWVNLFEQTLNAFGQKPSKNELYTTLYTKALEGDPSLDGFISYGYHSGESITQVHEGVPMLMRTPTSKLDLATFMRLHLSSAFATLALGMRLLEKEAVVIDKMVGHGGFFSTPKAGGTIAATALKSPIRILANADKGGAWGMALLANYMRSHAHLSLSDYLETVVFGNVESLEVEATPQAIEGFEDYLSRFEQGLALQRQAAGYF